MAHHSEYHHGPATQITLQRVPLNAQGYDRRGRYWGTGSALFSYEAEHERGHTTYGQLRAADRADAKKQLREMFPRAKIGR